MLNKNGERELAYLVKVGKVEKHPNADRLDIVQITGWKCITGLGDFKEGDFAVYFESDSQLPEVEPFVNNDFLAAKHFKIKTYRLRGEISDGLLMPVTAFGWEVREAMCAGMRSDGTTYSAGEPYVWDGENSLWEYSFLTKKLGVTYNIPEDNVRKANSGDRLQTIKGRHPNFFRNPIIKKLMKFAWFRKFMLVVFRKSAKKSVWPEWIEKTDEERCQNLPRWEENYAGQQHYVVTEKIDGTSTTMTFNARRKKGILVCSRNVVFDKPDKKCFYDSNVYTEMAEKYHMEDVLMDLMKKHPEWKFCAFQGETYGAGVQKRDYSMKDHDIRFFNFKDSENGRWGSVDAEKLAAEYGLKWVPIIDADYTLPDTVDDLLKYAHGTSVIDGKEREGIVLRSQDGKISFKAVDPEFILKYHNG